MIDMLLEFALAVVVLLILPPAYLIWRGPTAADRAQALDAVSTLLVAVMILLALVQQSTLMVDVALALAAFGFVSTMGISRYLAEGKVF